MPLYGKEVTPGNFRVIADWVTSGGTATLSALRGCCCGGGGSPDECGTKFKCGNRCRIAVSRVRYRSCKCFHDHCRMTPYVSFDEGYALGNACDSSLNICKNALQANQSIAWPVPGNTNWNVVNEVPTANTQTSGSCQTGTTVVSASVNSFVNAFCTGGGYIHFGNLSSCTCGDGNRAALGVTLEVSAGAGRSVVVCLGGTSYTVSSGQSRTIGEAVFLLSGGVIDIPFIVL